MNGTKTLTCKVCGGTIIPDIENHYISRDETITGLAALGKNEEAGLYDTFDCKVCGCQHIVQGRKRLWLHTQLLPTIEDWSEDDEN